MSNFSPLKFANSEVTITRKSVAISGPVKALIRAPRKIAAANVTFDEKIAKELPSAEILIAIDDTYQPLITDVLVISGSGGVLDGEYVLMDKPEPYLPPARRASTTCRK